MKKLVKIYLWIAPVLVILLTQIASFIYSSGLTVPWRLVGTPPDNFTKIIGVKFSERKLFIETASGDTYSVNFMQYMFTGNPAPAQWIKEKDNHVAIDPIVLQNMPLSPNPYPLLIVITGLPCSGKTALAEKIAGRVRLPLITKDGIKERLFDSLGWSDRAWSKKLGGATYELLFYLIDQFLSAGQSLIVESNFYPFHLERFRAIQHRVPFRVLQIQCWAEGSVLVERFRQRWERGERHPGHVDPETYAELDATLRQGKQPPLDLGGGYLEVDTTDFDSVDYERVFRFILEEI